jgi:hypothetical protein
MMASMQWKTSVFKVRNLKWTPMMLTRSVISHRVKLFRQKAKVCCPVQATNSR